MRPRKKKYCGERMEGCSDIWLKTRTELDEFLRDATDARVEIGCGKGTFICTMAQRCPETRFVAIERIPDVIVSAMEKAESLGLSNLRFFCGDARDITEYFAPQSISTLYINFCDPWHKRKHEKRRLTYREFLEKYKIILEDGGTIEFKTDNAPLFKFSQPEFLAAELQTISLTNDLHALCDPLNIVTEYEANFSAKGFKINRLIAKKPQMGRNSHMKIAFSTLGCPEWNLAEIISVASDLKYDGIEIRGVGKKIYAPDVTKFGAEKAEDTKALLRSKGLSIPIFTSACLLSSEKPDCLREGKDYIDLAKAMDAPFVRLLGDLTPEPTGAIDDALVLANLKELVLYAKGSGVTPLVETNGVYGDSKRLCALLDACGGEVGALWDVHHPFRYFGEEFEDTYNNLKKYIKHVHYKDSAISDGKIVYKMPGRGDLPTEKIVSLLKKGGYDGFLSLEWVRRWNRELEEAGIVFATYASVMRSAIDEA